MHEDILNTLGEQLKRGWNWLNAITVHGYTHHTILTLQILNRDLQIGIALVSHIQRFFNTLYEKRETEMIFLEDLQNYLTNLSSQFDPQALIVQITEFGGDK